MNFDSDDEDVNEEVMEGDLTKGQVPSEGHPFPVANAKTGTLPANMSLCDLSIQMRKSTTLSPGESTPPFPKKGHQARPISTFFRRNKLKTARSFTSIEQATEGVTLLSMQPIPEDKREREGRMVATSCHAQETETQQHPRSPVISHPQLSTVAMTRAEQKDRLLKRRPALRKRRSTLGASKVES